MKAVFDTDLLSTFAKIKRLDVLKELFEHVLIPNSVSVELRNGKIDIDFLEPEIARLSREELKALKGIDPRLGVGERECLVIAKQRRIPLATNEKQVHALCKGEGLAYVSLARVLRLAILERAVSREEARQIVKLIEQEEHTVLKAKEEIFK